MVLGVPVARAEQLCPSGTAHLSVTVSSAAGTSAPRVISCTELLGDADVASASYTVRSARNSDTRTARPGVSIDAALHAVQVPPAAVHFTTVSLPGARSRSTLSSVTHDFDDPGYPFADGPPVFFTTDGGVSLQYVRPQRSPDDDNAADSLQSLDDDELDLVVHLDGYLLSTTLAAPATLAAHASGTFVASTDQPAPGETLSYTFHFGDGSPAVTTASPSTTHAYAAAGSYYAYVDVSGSVGSTGESTSSHVTVAAASPTPSPSTPVHTTPAPGPSHGVGGRSNPVSGPSRAAGSSTRPDPLVTTPAGSSSVPRATSGAVTAARGSGSGIGKASASPAGGVVSSEAVSSVSSRGVRVAGFVLAGGAAVASAPAYPAAPVAARSGRPTPAPQRLLVTALAVVGVGSLLALGMVAELRRPSRAGRRRVGRDG